ncbi:hypothetical protein MACH09_46730 [Vibrio sp. MACH09]|uniref:hypothetical protein n=1 Tax=Vibrio sp. MACH09 TaxID=3025122 RepID=UPI00279300C2|nr:hypothetical protein [Vibrio sp. MACH09]GLO64165.1 hypothetical protein MACH09_46730 [Vibrio sp. MACH09]
MTYLDKKVTEYLSNHPEHKPYFEQFELAVVERNFHGSSMRTESRAISAVSDFAIRCIRFKENLSIELEAAKARDMIVHDDTEYFISTFEAQLKTRFNAWLSSEGNCLNPMVTGPARFPVARNRKNLDRAYAKFSEMTEFENKFLKSCLRKALPDGDGLIIKGDASNAAEQLEKQISSMKANHTRMTQINACVRKVFPKGSLKNGLGSDDVDTLISELIAKFSLEKSEVIDLLKPCRITQKVKPFASYTLSNHSQNIKRYEGRLKEQRSLDETREEVFGETIPNGISYHMTDDHKIAIDFGFKPNEDIRALLKKNAFKFSAPRGNLWIRKHTSNAMFAFKRNVLDVIRNLETE